MNTDNIYLGDCFDLIRQIPDGSIDLIITDPPYDIRVTSTGGSANKKLRLSDKLKPIEENNIHAGYDILSFSDEALRIQGGDINALFFCNKRQIPQYIDVYVNNLKCKFDILCWHKTNPMPTYFNKYLTDTEYCLYFHSGNNHAHPETYEDAKTYLVTELNQYDKKLYPHPTIKPSNFIQKLIRNHSYAGDTVLDPFIGSGTTAVAAIREGRRFLGFEINEKYFNIARARIQNELSQTKIQF